MNESKLVEINIFGLFGHLDHKIGLNTGGITFIHGPNGCGKTTVLRLIAAIFSSDNSTLFDTDFTSIEIINSDETKLTIFKKMSLDPNTERRDPTLSFSLTGEGSYELTRDFNNYNTTRFPLSDIEEFLPFLTRVGTREWIDRNSGKRIDYQEVLDKYGASLPHLANFRKPDWLSNYISSINLHFIKTQRLLKLDYVSSKRVRSEEHSVTEVIEIYSTEIKDIISRKLAEQAAVSQLHDRSFPERLLSLTNDESISESDIRDMYTETEKKIQGLVEAGLIDQQKNISLPSKKFEETEKKVLSLYLQDVNRKLSVFDELQNKIRVFLDIVAKKLKTKKFTVNRNDGFLIESVYGNGKPLQPEQLSSGEQHQIVLFYELVFKAEQNSFFLVDEPEISLHIDWQRTFLDDINKISSLGDRSFLIATHSPQIIGNYRDLAVALEAGIFEND